MLIHNFVIVKSTENFKDSAKINCMAVIQSCNCNPQKTEKNDLYKGCIQLAFIKSFLWRDHFLPFIDQNVLLININQITKMSLKIVKNIHLLNENYSKLNENFCAFHVFL